MMDRINNESLWIRLNNAILFKTRAENPWKVRQAALSVIKNQFDLMGERYLIVLNDTIPMLSECLEDEKVEVEDMAKEIVKKIEEMTGESI